MKRGPIPKKKNVIMLTPEARLKLMDDLKILEDQVLKIKNVLLIKKMNIQEQIDNLLIVYNGITVIHSSLRDLDGMVKL